MKYAVTLNVETTYKAVYVEADTELDAKNLVVDLMESGKLRAWSEEFYFDVEPMDNDSSHAYEKASPNACSLAERHLVERPA